MMAMARTIRKARKIGARKERERERECVRNGGNGGSRVGHLIETVYCK